MTNYRIEFQYYSCDIHQFPKTSSCPPEFKLPRVKDISLNSSSLECPMVDRYHENVIIYGYGNK